MASTINQDQVAAEPRTRGRGRPRGSGTAVRRIRERKPTKQEMLQALAESEVRAVVEELGAWSVCDPSSDRAGAVRMSRDKKGDGHGCRRDARAILEREMATGGKLRPDPATGLPLFVDNHASASAIGKATKGGSDPRKSYARLLELIRAGHVHTMIFTKLDRICRDLMDINELCTLANDAALHGDTVVFESLSAETIDLNSAPLRGVACVLATFGQMETEMTRERVMTENGDKRKDGWFTGGLAPMGMVKDANAPGGIKPDNELRAVMVDALESAIAGETWSSIADRWERDGVPRALDAEGKQRTNEPWNGQLVKQAVARDTLAGRLTYQPPADSKGQRAPRAYVRQGAWEAIYSETQWHMLQDLLALNRQGRDKPLRSRFTELFVCPCGGTLYRHKQAKSGSWNWSCMSAKGGCGHNAINGPALEAWVDEHTPARVAKRGLGNVVPTVDMERLTTEIRGHDGRLALMEEWFAGGRYDDDPERYERERRLIERKRDKARMEHATHEAELLGAKRRGDGLVAADYTDADELGKRKLIDAAFPHGILAAKGQAFVALGADGHPEASEEAA